MIKRITKTGLILFIAAVFAVFSAFGAAAEDVGDDIQGSYLDEPSAVESDVEPVETEPAPVETTPATEYIEPETEYVPPETEYVPPETEYVAPVDDTEDNENPTSAQDEYIALIGDAQEPTDNMAPKMDKSVSNKSYSTDYTAGIVSWICVGVGIIVVIVVLISTKVSGARASQRLV